MLYRIWKYFSPFGLLKDASRGTFAERAAAYRYNCRMRGCLPAYISRWLVSCAAALLLTAFFDALGTDGAGIPMVFVILATAHAVFAAVGICAISVLGYAYVSLSYGAVQSGDVNHPS